MFLKVWEDDVKGSDCFTTLFRACSQKDNCMQAANKKMKNRSTVTQLDSGASGLI